jgi:hypothetical protein
MTRLLSYLVAGVLLALALAPFGTAATTAKFQPWPPAIKSALLKSCAKAPKKRRPACICTLNWFEQHYTIAAYIGLTHRPAKFKAAEKKAGVVCAKAK